MSPSESQTEVDFLRGRVVELEKKLLHLSQELIEARAIIAIQEQMVYIHKKGDTEYEP